MTRILGIDPGSQITGFGVIESVDGANRYVASGCIRVGRGALGERLREILEGVGDVVAEYGPQEMAVEKVFVHRNPDSALKLGQARGAAVCAGVLAHLSLSEYSPSEIKQAVVGRGGAQKGQVQHMIRVLLGLPAAPQPDAADALAVALCHAHTRRTVQRMGTGAAS